MTKLHVDHDSHNVILKYKILHSCWLERYSTKKKKREKKVKQTIINIDVSNDNIVQAL